MTCKEQNKILDDKIESNVNQCKVDRLNAEISAFSSGDLNKSEFLTKKDLKYKPKALDKARFQFSPLGKAFNIGLDKTAQGDKEEGVIKLLRDIRDGLRSGIEPKRPGTSPGPRGLDRSNDGNDDDDDDDDGDDGNGDDGDNKTDMPELETEEDAVKRIADYNKQKNNIVTEIDDFYKKYENKEDKLSNILNKLNDDIKKLDNYIKENNNKKIDIKNKLGTVENKLDNLLLEYNKSNEELKKTKNELDILKDNINELKEVQEKFDYQNAKTTKLKSELDEKDKNINDLKKELEDIEQYINNQELDRLDALKMIDKLNASFGHLNKEKEELIKLLNDKHEYNNKLDDKHKKEIEEINDKFKKGLNKIDNQYKKVIDDFYKKSKNKKEIR